MSIAIRLAEIRSQMAHACTQAHRGHDSVKLVAVSKGQPTSAIVAAYEAGQRDFGENYASELKEKREILEASCPDLVWHFIGRVQASNTKEIARATLVHGVGALEQAQALAKRGAVPVLLQVSLWDELSKNGFSQAEIERDLPALQQLGILVRGLMAMPPAEHEPGAAFAQVRQLAVRLGVGPELSMGMSADFAAAVLEGATLVRVGSALFGPRSPA